MTFLNGNSGRSFYDVCIQTSCLLEDPLAVELVTTTLSLSPDYQRAPMPCSQCGSEGTLSTRAA